MKKYLLSALLGCLLVAPAFASSKPPGGNPIGGFDMLFNYNWLNVNDDGSINVTVNSMGGTTTVVQPTGSNLHAVTDTGSTTACTQATGTNLHAVTDTGSTTACTQATGTNLHAVIDSGIVSQTASGSSLGNALQTAQTGAANGTQLTITGYGTAVFNVTGTFNGANVNFEVSPDNGTTWVPLTVSPQVAAPSPTTIATTTGVFQSSISGFTTIRARTSSVGGSTSLTVTVNLVPLVNNNVVTLNTAVAPTVTANAGTGTFTASLVPAASGGETSADVQSASGTNATSVKASAAGQVYLYTFCNQTTTTWEWVHFYNTAGAPTAGSATGYKFSVPVSPGGCAAGGAIDGLAFSAGIGYTITGGYASSDTTAVAAGDITGEFGYK